MAWNAREKTAFNRGWSAGCGVQRRVCGLGLCRPTRRVTSWLNRDVNPCPACLPGLLWESKETPRVKGAFQATVLHKCKLLWFSLVVFGKLVSFYISRVSSTPPPTVRSKVFAFLLKSEEALIWQKEMKSPGLLWPQFTSRPSEEPAPCKARQPSPRHPHWGEVRQSPAVTAVWISLCRSPDKQRGKVQRSGSASEMWEGQQSLKCMGMEGNLILLQRGEGTLHHMKIIASGQQSLGVWGGGLAHWPICKRALTAFCAIPEWICTRAH